MTDVSRRLILQLIGAGAAVACGGDDASTGQTGVGAGGEAGAAAGGGVGAAGHPLATGGAAGHAAAGASSGAGGAAMPAGAGGKGAGGAAGKGTAGAAGKGTAGAAGKGEAGAAGKGEAGNGAAGEAQAGAAGDGQAGESGAGGAPVGTVDDVLASIDHFVVVMMENRSFDHFLGSLQHDNMYMYMDTVRGTNGTETNPDGKGKAVALHKTTNWTLDSPPHTAHYANIQWDNGKNDGFVKAMEQEDAAGQDCANCTCPPYAADHAHEAMAYYDRTQLPFYYWLADTFCLCDSWHASVLGPTLPNRSYLHSGTSMGIVTNTDLTGVKAADLPGGKFPKTIWDRLADAGLQAQNYYPCSSIFHAIYVNYLTPNGPGVNPGAPLDDFFTRAQAGTLPNVSYIEPDYGYSSDHPAHDIRNGQSFVASIYSALAASPQWNKTLLIVIYDEHGGFYDHVHPQVAPDDYAITQRWGFRVPAFIIGPMVKRAGLVATRFDHTSVLATLAKRFDLPSFGARTDAAADLTGTLDAALFGAPLPAPPIPEGVKPAVYMTQKCGDDTGDPGDPGDMTCAATMNGIKDAPSQPELDEMVASGRIPAEWVDQRSFNDRVENWFGHAKRLGAVRARKRTLVKANGRRPSTSRPHVQVTSVTWTTAPVTSEMKCALAPTRAIAASSGPSSKGTPTRGKTTVSAIAVLAKETTWPDGNEPPPGRKNDAPPPCASHSVGRNLEV